LLVRTGATVKNRTSWVDRDGFSPLCFRHADGANGNELWVADEEFGERHLLKDIKPGAASSDPTELTQLGAGKAVFVADDGIYGRELWITDGTGPGTRMLRDIGTGDGTFGPTNLVPTGDGRVFFTANDGAHGSELWVSDGTMEGTQRLTDGVLGATGSSPDAVMGLGNGKWLFTALGADGARDLWVTDGTAGGTTVIRAVEAGERLELLDITVSSDGGVAMVHTNKGSFTTDGTEGGTSGLVAHVANIDYHAVEGGRWIFADLDRTDVSAREYSLFSTDGTAKGTVKILDPREQLIGGTSGGEAKLTDLGNGKVIIQGDGGLWVTDGTREGTHSIGDGILTSRGATDFVSLGDGRALFLNQDRIGLSSPVTKADLWVTDGTREGTFQIADSHSWNAGSLPDKVNVLDDGSVVFSAPSMDGNPNAVWHVNMWAGGLERLEGVSNWAGDYQPTRVVGLDVPDPVSTILLSDIAAGQGGFKIIGEEAGDYAGRSLAAIGDLNGDGLTDLLVGADYNGVTNNSGAAYVVYGKTGGAAVDLSDVAAGQGGFKIIGEAEGSFASYAGRSVAAAGDVNGDGVADLLIGSPGNSGGGNTAGAAYVVFGGAGGAAVALDAVAVGNGGFKIIGETAGDGAGDTVSALGDVNGDGLNDLIVGALQDSTGGTFAGAAYVVFGKAVNGTVDLHDVAAGQGGFKIIGEALYNGVGNSASAAGDVNGDGLADLIVGAGSNSPGGAAYVVFGKTGHEAVNLDDIAAGRGGFKIIGEASGDNAGRSVSSAGDVNGDGLTDLLVGASGNDAAGRLSGASYLVFGKADGGAVNLSAVADGAGGFKITGEAVDDRAGEAVSAAGDVNGDGFADLMVGARLQDANGYDSGAAYVIYGSSDWHI
jgi:ELWxxDGT repeat protein